MGVEKRTVKTGFSQGSPAVNPPTFECRRRFRRAASRAGHTQAKIQDPGLAGFNPGFGGNAATVRGDGAGKIIADSWGNGEAALGAVRGQRARGIRPGDHVGAFLQHQPVAAGFQVSDTLVPAALAKVIGTGVAA